jgi:hypothetical protein
LYYPETSEKGAEKNAQPVHTAKCRALLEDMRSSLNDSLENAQTPLPNEFHFKSYSAPKHSWQQMRFQEIWACLSDFILNKL